MNCAAAQKVAAYVRGLSSKQVLQKQASSLVVASNLIKIAAGLECHGNIFRAVDDVFLGKKSAADRHMIIRGIVQGYLKSAMGPLHPEMHPEPAADVAGPSQLGEAFKHPLSSIGNWIGGPLASNGNSTSGMGQSDPANMPPPIPLTPEQQLHADHPWWDEEDSPQAPAAPAAGGSSGPSGSDLSQQALGALPAGGLKPPAGAHDVGLGANLASMGSSALGAIKHHPYISAGVGGAGLLGALYMNHRENEKERERQEAMQQMAARGGAQSPGGGGALSRILEYR